MANSADPDQLASEETNCHGSTLFVKAGHIWVQQDQGYEIIEANSMFFILFSGNPDILEEINSNVDFSYVRILKMMYSRDDDVRLLAGSALAAFAYNNINQQKEIAEQGGVRFNCFVPFLQSSDEHFRCNAAFQVSLTFTAIGVNFSADDILKYLSYFFSRKQVLTFRAN